MKQVAKALLFLEEHDIRDLDLLNQRAREAADRFNELSTTIKSAEKRMAEVSVLKTHILNYAKTKDVYGPTERQGTVKPSLKLTAKISLFIKRRSRHFRSWA